MYEEPLYHLNYSQGKKKNSKKSKVNSKNCKVKSVFQHVFRYCYSVEAQYQENVWRYCIYYNILRALNNNFLEIFLYLRDII